MIMMVMKMVIIIMIRFAQLMPKSKWVRQPGEEVQIIRMNLKNMKFQDFFTGESDEEFVSISSNR